MPVYPGALLFADKDEAAGAADATREVSGKVG
jgi:hypothetical protein